VSNEPTQTTPKGEMIPVPAREDVIEALRKAAKVKRDENEKDQGNSSR
jgi:hypothetical protein